VRAKASKNLPPGKKETPLPRVALQAAAERAEREAREAQRIAAKQEATAASEARKRETPLPRVALQGAAQAAEKAAQQAAEKERRSKPGHKSGGKGKPKGDFPPPFGWTAGS
jgi:hypothetical protein